MSALHRERLRAAVALRAAGRAEESRPLLVALAAEAPDDAETQYQAAWVHDLLGLEREAVPYYERALALGLPEPEREGLVLGLGSTYRNVGRIADALTLLERGVRDYPANDAMRCFLALAELANDDPDRAVARLLTVILDSSASPSIDRYRRALGEYRDELVGDSGTPNTEGVSAPR